MRLKAIGLAIAFGLVTVAGSANAETWRFGLEEIEGSVQYEYAKEFKSKQKQEAKEAAKEAKFQAKLDAAAQKLQAKEAAKQAKIEAKEAAKAEKKAAKEAEKADKKLRKAVIKDTVKYITDSDKRLLITDNAEWLEANGITATSIEEYLALITSKEYKKLLDECEGQLEKMSWYQNNHVESNE